ncbi:MAG: RNA polymerase sigma factor [Gaiellaceae bacterium]
MTIDRVVGLDSARDADFSEFYEREHPIQVRRAFVLVRSNEAANDLVHDAMIEVFTRWRELDHPGGYLNRAVLNRCRDFGRRSQTRRRLLTRLVDGDSQPGPQEPLGDLFDRLPFKQRAAVVLRYYSGLSIAEIAETLDCPQGSVGPWIDRALKSLKEYLP